MFDEIQSSCKPDSVSNSPEHMLHEAWMDECSRAASKPLETAIKTADNRTSIDIAPIGHEYQPKSANAELQITGTGAAAPLVAARIAIERAKK